MWVLINGEYVNLDRFAKVVLSDNNIVLISDTGNCFRYHNINKKELDELRKILDFSLVIVKRKGE